MAQRMGMFPLSTVLFPHAPLPLHVFEERYRQLTTDCLTGTNELGITLITRGSEVGGGDERAPVGTVAAIEAARPFPDGRWALLVRGRRRIRVRRWVPDDPYPLADVEELPTTGTESDGTGAGLARAEAAVRRARALLSEMGRAPAIAADLDLGSEPEAVSWSLCALAPVTPHDAQRLLVEDDLVTRLHLLADLNEALADDLQRLLADGQG